jgi:hypothetical protein
MSMLLGTLMSMAAPAAGGGSTSAGLNVTPAGSASSVAGSADYFTGNVRIDGGFQRPAPARVGGATVTFEPGARTAWHTHPLGQTLIVAWAGCSSGVSRASRSDRVTPCGSPRA